MPTYVVSFPGFMIQVEAPSRFDAADVARRHLDKINGDNDVTFDYGILSGEDMPTHVEEMDEEEE